MAIHEQLNDEEAARFCSKIFRSEFGGCWYWAGCLTPQGYGAFGTWRKGTGLAHRICWELFIGPIPDGMVLIHSCDNPMCVNINHLRVGTQAENLSDMALKGRASRGSHRTHSKLNDQLVGEIINLHASGVSQCKLAKQFGVTRWVINSVVKRTGWKHVTL